MKTILDVELAGQRVWCRVDFNVPLDAGGNITDDTRIRGALPTIRHAVEKGAKVIVASHLGRPKGKPAPQYSLSPVARRLSELLDRPVEFAPDCVGPEAEARAASLADGDVLLLENLRYHAGEEANDDAFAVSLARLCDVYVNDAFAVCHRRHASVDAIVRHAPVAVAGLLLKDELDYYARAMTAPSRPLAAIVGGAKVSSKLKALNKMLDRVDLVVIGGAMANTFLKFMGIEVGASLVEDDMVEAAGDVLRQAAEKGIRTYLPVDAVVADRFDASAVTKIVPVDHVPEGWMILDIGPATSLLFAEAIQDARTIVWNGPMGAFEMDAFSRGTLALVADMGRSHALTVVGGGDTDTAVHQAGGADRMSFISTGGGAFLNLMEGKTLPAVAALEAAQGGGA